MDVPIWLIDPESLVLHRDLFSGAEEEVIPITMNPAMTEFMCIDKDDYGKLLEAYQ